MGARSFKVEEAIEMLFPENPKHKRINNPVGKYLKCGCAYEKMKPVAFNEGWKPTELRIEANQVILREVRPSSAYLWDKNTFLLVGECQACGTLYYRYHSGIDNNLMLLEVD